jgi:uncharacterized membrane protein YgdD (TMEM256/DUF423 family)
MSNGLAVLGRRDLVLPLADAASAKPELMNWSAVAAGLLALAVGLGAFGAHVLKNRLDAYSMSIYEKAVFYHFIHALGILLVAVLAHTAAISPAGQQRVAWLLLIGIVVFSGSLYALAISGVRILGAVTPVGGLAFILGWLVLLYEALHSPRA